MFTHIYIYIYTGTNSSIQIIVLITVAVPKLIMLIIVLILCHNSTTLPSRSTVQFTRTGVLAVLDTHPCGPRHLPDQKLCVHTAYCMDDKARNYYIEGQKFCTIFEFRNACMSA